MKNPILTSIEREYARRCPISFQLAQPRVMRAVAGWVQQMNAWMEAYPSNAPELAAWGLNAEQAAYCKVAWRYRKLLIAQPRTPSFRAQVLRWALDPMYGKPNLEKIPNSQDLLLSVAEQLRNRAMHEYNSLIKIRPTCLLRQPIYRDQYLTGQGLRDLKEGHSIQVGGTIWRISNYDEPYWTQRGIEVLDKKVRGNDVLWERRWQEECSRRWHVMKDTRPFWSGGLLEVYDTSEPIQVDAYHVPHLCLEKLEDHMQAVSERVATYLGSCKERLEAEVPIGLAPWEVRFGGPEDQELERALSVEGLFFTSEVFLFQGPQIIRLEFPMVGEVQRRSYLIPRDVLFATVDGLELHVECRGHRALTLVMPNWKRAKELQDHIERHRTPPQREHRQPSRSWR